jgi:hypothetical protein
MQQRILELGLAYPGAATRPSSCNSLSRSIPIDQDSNSVYIYYANIYIYSYNTPCSIYNYTCAPDRSCEGITCKPLFSCP